MMIIEFIEFNLFLNPVILVEGWCEMIIQRGKGRKDDFMDDMR